MARVLQSLTRGDPWFLVPAVVIAGLLFSWALGLFEDPPGAPPDAGALREAAESWLGVPYRMGGQDRAGIDCSGLALQLLPGAELPRRARDMRRIGRRVGPSQLQPGDLVFFDTARADGLKGHVGVALGPDDFVHATSSRGVIISRFDDAYWGPLLVGARRPPPRGPP